MRLRLLAGYDRVVAACATACKALSPPADVFALECAGSEGTACKCRHTGASSPSEAKAQVDLETSETQALGADTAWYGCFSKAGSSCSYVSMGAGYPSFEGEQNNRRCGTHGGANDTTSAMCAGATWDGQLHLPESEVQARCDADDTCVGYGRHGGQNYYRPVVAIDAATFANHWSTFEKRCPALQYDDGDPVPGANNYASALPCADFLACTIACAQQGMLFWQDRQSFSDGQQGCVLASSITAANGWTKWPDDHCPVADSWNRGVGWRKGGFSDGVEKMAVFSDGCRGHRGLAPCSGTAPITHRGFEWALGGSSRASVYFIPPADTVAMMRVAPPSNFAMSVLKVVQADEPRGMALSSGYLYTTAGDGMAVLDVSDPTSPTLVGNVIPSSDSVMQSISVSPAYVGIAVLASYAYLTERDSGALAVVSIARAQSPRGMGVVKHPMLAGAVAVAVVANRYGQPAYAYVAGSYADALVVVDIDDAVSPRVVASVTSATYLNQAYDVAAGPTNDKVYVVGRISHSLAVVDVSLPSAPTIVGGLINANQLRFATACALWGGSHIVVVGTQTVATVDISDPTLPRVVGSVSDRSKLDYMSGVTVDGDHAYVAGTDSNSLGVIELTNPAAPAVVTSLQSSSDSFIFEEPDSVAVLHTSAGSYAYASAFGSDGLVVLRIPPPPPSDICDRYCPAKCSRAIAAAAAALDVDLTRSTQVAANLSSSGLTGLAQPTLSDLLNSEPSPPPPPCNQWTASATGGQCYFDLARTDCAICNPGGCQCWEAYKDMCIQCGGTGCGVCDPSPPGSGGSSGSGRRLYAQTSGVPRIEAECAECAGCRAAGYHVTSTMQWKEPFRLDNNEYFLGAPCLTDLNSNSSNLSTSVFLSTDAASPTLLGNGTDARWVTLYQVRLGGGWLTPGLATTVAQVAQVGAYTPTACFALWYACDEAVKKAVGINVTHDPATDQLFAHVYSASYGGECDAYPLPTSAPSAPSSTSSGYGVEHMNYTITTPSCPSFTIHPAFYDFDANQLDSFMSLSLPYLSLGAQGESLTSSSVPCGCEVFESFFCNHDNGPGSGSCEPCSDFDSATSCYNDGLPVLGVSDCLNWCFGITQVDTSQLNSDSGSGGGTPSSRVSMHDFLERPCETYCLTFCASEASALSGGHCAICAYLCPNVYAGGKAWISRLANPSDTDVHISTDTGGRWLPMPGVATTIELPEARVVLAFSSMCAPLPRKWLAPHRRSLLAPSHTHTSTQTHSFGRTSSHAHLTAELPTTFPLLLAARLTLATLETQSLRSRRSSSWMVAR